MIRHLARKTATIPPFKCEKCLGRPGTLYIDTYLCETCRKVLGVDR